MDATLGGGAKLRMGALLRTVSFNTFDLLLLMPRFAYYIFCSTVQDELQIKGLRRLQSSAKPMTLGSYESQVPLRRLHSKKK